MFRVTPHCQKPLAILAMALLGCGSTSVNAQDGSYFSGVRFGASEKAWSFTAPGLKLGQALEFARAGELSNTAFSGYQFANGFALGAAVNNSSTESVTAIRGSGVGLKFNGTRWAGAAEARSGVHANVNVDVVSAFNWQSSFSVFGKLGVGRAAAEGFALSGPPAQDRTAISYGLGMRYDFTPSLGLKLEVTRGTRFGWDRLRTETDPDAVNLGIRWSF